MRLAHFITQNMESILVQWESFATSLLPAARGMTSLALRDHEQQILQAVALDPMLDCVFEPMVRATYDETDSSGSLGLGLYIVREIVRGHGGTVSVRSNEPEGTTFAVTLPRALPAPDSNHASIQLPVVA